MKKVSKKGKTIKVKAVEAAPTGNMVITTQGPAPMPTPATVPPVAPLAQIPPPSGPAHPTHSGTPVAPSAPTITMADGTQFDVNRNGKGTKLWCQFLCTYSFKRKSDLLMAVMGLKTYGDLARVLIADAMDKKGVNGMVSF